MARAEHPSDLLYHRQLLTHAFRDPDGSRAIEWLTARGITYKLVCKYKLGVVLEPKLGHEGFHGMVTIPYYDAQGRYRALRARNLAFSKRRWGQKYLLIEGRPHMFGVRYTGERVCYVTEGEFDAIVLRRLGLDAAGVPGATAWQWEWRWLFRNCDEVVIVPDNDGETSTGRRGKTVTTGGLHFRLTLMQSLKGVPGPRVRFVLPPPGLDPTEWFLKDRRGMKEALTR